MDRNITRQIQKINADNETILSNMRNLLVSSKINIDSGTWDNAELLHLTHLADVYNKKADDAAVALNVIYKDRIYDSTSINTAIANYFRNAVWVSDTIPEIADAQTALSFSVQYQNKGLFFSWDALAEVKLRIKIYKTTGTAQLYDPSITNLDLTIKSNMPGGYFSRLTSAIETPTGNAIDCAWSSDGAYLSILSTTTAPYLFLYKCVDGVLTKIANPAEVPYMATRCDWSPDGTYLAVSHKTTPYITIYRRTSDTFTKINNPAVLPSDDSTDCSWSPDGVYLSVTYSASPYIMTYKMMDGEFIKLPNPDVLPSGQATGCSWSPDGTKLLVTHHLNPYITIYGFSNDAFVKAGNPSILPSNTCLSCSFAPNGLYVAVSMLDAPYIVIYKITSGVFTKIENPAVLPSGKAGKCSWSADSAYLFTPTESVADHYSIMYQRDADVFTEEEVFASFPAGPAGGSAWSTDGTYLVIAHENTPYITIYETAKTSATNGDYERIKLFNVVTDADLPAGDYIFTLSIIDNTMTTSNYDNYFYNSICIKSITLT